MASSNPTIEFRDFETRKVGFTLPASRLASYDDTLEKAFVPMFRNPRVYDAHMHWAPENCGPQVEKDKWNRGEYFRGEKLTFWVHFIKRPRLDKYGFALRKETNKQRARSKGLEGGDENHEEEEIRGEKKHKRRNYMHLKINGDGIAPRPKRAVGTALMYRPEDIAKLRRASPTTTPLFMTQRNQPTSSIPFISDDQTRLNPAFSLYDDGQRVSTGYKNGTASSVTNTDFTKLSSPAKAELLVSDCKSSSNRVSERRACSESPLFEPEASDTDPGSPCLGVTELDSTLGWSGS